MKKTLQSILALILSAAMLVMLSLSVFADMSAPETRDYDVVVNPGGLVTKDGDFIPEGTVLTIKWEYYYSDDIWGATEWNGKYNVEINLADVTNGDVIPEKSGEVSSTRGEAYLEVFGENGVDVYAGPGHAYKVLFNVPKGERINGDSWVIDWVYVRYGDQGGWICPRLADVVTYHDEPVTVWVLRDTELLKEQQFGVIDHGGNTLCTIPAGMKLDSYYSSVAYGLYYVTYEGQSGWVDTFRTVKAIAEKDTKHYQATEDGTLCLFNEPFDYNEEILDPTETLSMKKGDRFSVSYSLWSYDTAPVSWYYIESDSVSGWTPVCWEGEIASHPYSSDLHEYEAVKAEQPDDETTDTLPEDVTEDETKEVEPKDVIPPESDTIGNETNDGVTESDTNGNETKPDGFFSSPTAIIAVCAVSAVVLALVAAVVLMIIRKKRIR